MNSFSNLLFLDCLFSFLSKRQNESQNNASKSNNFFIVVWLFAADFWQTSTSYFIDAVLLWVRRVSKFHAHSHILQKSDSPSIYLLQKIESLTISLHSEFLFYFCIINSVFENMLYNFDLHLPILLLFCFGLFVNVHTALCH